MSRRDSHLPERWRTAGATALEQRLLNAASREQPSRELCESMAAAIGVAPPAPVVTSPPAAPEVTSGGAGTGTLAPKAVAASNAPLPWITGAVVAAVVAGVVVYSSASTSHPPSVQDPAPAFPAQAPPLPAPAAPAEGSIANAPSEAAPPAAARAPSPGTTALSRAQPARESSRAVDLSDQIALVDSARAAVSAGAGDRALSLLRQYQERYPAGSFRPEASALRIEALVKVGRRTEARALAERFVAEHRGSPLADRVARVAGLSP